MTKKEYRAPHVALVFWQWDIGGVQTRMTDVITALNQAHGVCVTLLLRKKIQKERPLPKHSALFETIYCPKYFSWSRWLFFFWSIFRLAACEPTHILSVLNRFQVIAVIAKWLISLRGKKVKIVLNQPIYTSFYIAQFEAWYWTYLVTFFYNKADVILVQTNAVADDLQTQFGVRKELLKIIPNWTNVRTMNHKKFFDLIFIGRLSPEKGLTDFLYLCEIRAAADPTFRACIVGDGKLKAALLSWLRAHRLQGRIWYAGYQQNALPWVAQARVLCLFSKNEGMPMSVLEAMSMGVPAVINNFPGAHEVVSHGVTGYVCNTQAEYATSSERLLGDRALYERFSRAAQSHIKKYFDSKNLSIFVDTLLKNTD